MVTIAPLVEQGTENPFVGGSSPQTTESSGIGSGSILKKALSTLFDEPA